MKKYLSNILRKLGLLFYADKIHFYIEFIRNRKTNKQFKKNHPEIKLPPDYLMYESFQINYQKYYHNSIESAQWLLDHLKQHTKVENKRILDWGCGPARIIRHLPALADNTCEIHGTDYNKKTINWCSKNIENVTFHLNDIYPPLPFGDNYFDIVYGISVFTHLPEKSHDEWANEILRILKKDGIFLFTTHGVAFKVKLTKDEQKEFDKGHLVTKGNTKPGHRTFSTYHPPAFIRHLMQKNEILSHTEGKMEDNKLQQDVWIIRKTG